MLPMTRPRPLRRMRVGRARRSSAERPLDLALPAALDEAPPPRLLHPPAPAPQPAVSREPAPDGRWLRVILVLAPAAAIAVGATGIALSLVSNPIEIFSALVLPLAILGLLVLGERPGARVAAALALDVEALLTGLVSPAGMAFALVLPLIAVRLVQPRTRGRILFVIFCISATTAIVGVAAALTIGPARSLMPVASVVLTILSFAAVSAFALGLDWRATGHLTASLAATEAELAERVAAERRLRETSEILSAILTSSPVATQAFDRRRNVIVWNPASERTFGWTADEVVGRPLPPEMIPAEDREASRERIERTLAGSTTNGDRVRRLTKDGDERWVDIYAAPLLDHDGTPIGIAGQMVDVTHRVRMEAQLTQAQKMGAVGLLASGIAHDFNNTLTAAAGYAELIRSNSDGVIREDATTLMEVVDRGRQLTRQLLDFARRGDGEPGHVDIRDVVIGIEPLIRRLIGGSVTVELSLAGEPLYASVQTGQLEQSLVNLAINARDAMPGGGRLLITVDIAGPDDQAQSDEGTLTVVAVGRDRRRRPDDLEIIVVDTGAGILPSMIANVFEPFFTTKPVGVGTGLGLAMVRGFVETTGGSLTVTSGPGKGTSFAIRMPRSARFSGAG